MSLEITNEDYSITITPSGAWTPGDPTYIPTLTTKSLASNKKILTTILTWTISNCTLAGFSHNGGAGSISPTSTKVLCESNKPLRNQDSGNCAGTFTKTTAPFNVIPCACVYQITDAGQAKVKGE